MNLTIIQKSIDYIEDNLKTDITAKELSEMAGFSMFHYYRLFHSAVGLPVMQYITRRRLLNALYDIEGSFMKKYVGINTSFGHNVLENFDEYEFRTNMSLFDYDAVILSTYFVTSNYKYETTNSYEKTPRKYQGIIVLDEDEKIAPKG